MMGFGVPPCREAFGHPSECPAGGQERTKKTWAEKLLSEELEPVVLSSSWNNQGKFLHHFAQEGALRHRRQAEKGKRLRPCRSGTICAAHYEVQATVGRAGMQADANGTIRGWAEAKLNATNPLRYDNSRGEFTVIKRGLYYLYCQVHFNEGKTVYMKLDVMLSGQLALRCLEQFPPTSSGPREAELHVCQVSGLLLLRPEASIRLRTIPDVRLKADRYLTYFGLFQTDVWVPASRGRQNPKEVDAGLSPEQGRLKGQRVWLESGERGREPCRSGEGRSVMSGGPPDPSGDPCHANPSGSAAEPSPKPGTPLGEGCGCKPRIIWEANLGGPSPPLLGTRGVPDLGPVGQEAPKEKLSSGKKAERTMPVKIWRGVLSPFPGLDSWGLRQQRPPTPWAVVGVLAVGLLACLFVLFSIQASLESLREELAALRREGVCQATGTDDNREAPDSRQRDVGGPVPPERRTRRTRDVGKTPQDLLARPRRKHSVLHLVPARHSNNEEGDATEIWWAPFLQQGRALEPSGQDVVVKHTGLYFVYSQVLFHDPTFTMGQVLRRVALGRPDQILFRCIQSMPPKVEKAYNSCYSGGVFYLQQGDRLSLRIPRFNASFDISTHGTFLGVLRL
ncbi:tumor necrosis factor ligand superfamily member 12 [Ahaetulla prasina]|uniref:tumor necrosis factor ligand superfamily member 12 n=1 Tax=Ahaetulla prasina TaxID=499056 RepID=UPI00264A246F|nr:tumor necrosis factor ligand superfamily member 12 [Ahaetulla prasina]